MKFRETIENLTKLLGLDHQNSSKVEQFDDRKYKFSLYLINQDANAIKLRKGSIHELYLEDNILEWFHKGHLTVNNPDDVIERAESLYLGDNIHEDRAKIKPYRIRGDCRDFILLTFEPHIESTGTTDGGTTDTVESMTYSIKFLFVVYATEDVIGDTKKEKKQKLYFHDYRYQMLREKNLYYSTGKSIRSAGRKTVSTTPVTHLNNRGREKPTGEIIQDILKTSLPKPDTDGLFSYHWDFGGTNLFYTSPADYTALDDLHHVLDRHVSVSDYEYQPCILKLQRQTERWELLPVTEYFKRSNTGSGPGVYQTEHFLLSNDSEPNDVRIPPERKTFGRDVRTPDVNYHFPDVSVINDYVFSEINGVDCQELLNSVIMHRHSIREKEFNVDLQPANIKTIHEKFQSLFIDHTYGGVGGHGVNGWLPDSSREQNFNFSVAGSTSSEMHKSYAAGRNKMLLGAFLLGNTIQFDVRGETSRRSGVWIAVDRDTNYIDNAYEMKILGQYFVTRVVHRITPTGEYTNNVMGVKPYLYQDLGFKTRDMLEKNTNITPEL